jgi:sterol 24-C-methyltransferase
MPWRSESGSGGDPVLKLSGDEVNADINLRRAHYQEHVTGYYQCVTEVYREFWGDSYHFALFDDGETREQALAKTERRIATQGNFQPGLQILDLGCGLGGPALEIAAFSGVSITGIDLCEHHVRIAQERAKNKNMQHCLRLVAGDAMHLPFPDGVFDRVYLFESGCHTPDKMALCKECFRILKNGGEFLGLDWMQRDGLSVEEESALIEPICKYCAVPDLASPHRMREHLEQSAFQVLASEQVSSLVSLLPNWVSFRPKPTFSSRHWDQKALQQVSLGGTALAEATRAGAFIIGHWHARRPL